MSINFSIYLGGTIKITKNPQIDVPKVRNVCSNDNRHYVDKSNRRNENFCSICGNAIIQESYIEKRNISFHEILEKYSFYGYENNIISNNNKFCKRIDEDDHLDEEFLFNSDKFNLDKFKEYAKPLLEELDNNGFEYEISNRIITIYN